MTNIYERIYNKLSKIVNLEELKKKIYGFLMKERCAVVKASVGTARWMILIFVSMDRFSTM